MTRNYIRYTKEILEPLCKESISYAEVLKKLGLRLAGGNFANLQRNIDKFQIDISHMKHQASNQGKEVIAFDSLKKRESIKRRYIQQRQYCCEWCGISEWNDRPLTLELDHIDGNNRNNSIENLRLLCPNCHSQTNTFRNKHR